MRDRRQGEDGGREDASGRGGRRRGYLFERGQRAESPQTCTQSLACPVDDNSLSAHLARPSRTATGPIPKSADADQSAHKPGQPLRRRRNLHPHLSIFSRLVAYMSRQLHD